MKRIVTIILIPVLFLMNAFAQEGWVFIEMKERGSTTGEFKNIFWGDFCYLKILSKDKKEHTFHCGEYFNDADPLLVLSNFLCKFFRV